MHTIQVHVWLQGGKKVGGQYYGARMFGVPDGTHNWENPQEAIGVALRLGHWYHYSGKTLEFQLPKELHQKSSFDLGELALNGSLPGIAVADITVN